MSDRTHEVTLIMQDTCMKPEIRKYQNVEILNRFEVKSILFNLRSMVIKSIAVQRYTNEPLR